MLARRSSLHAVIKQVMFKNESTTSSRWLTVQGGPRKARRTGTQQQPQRERIDNDGDVDMDEAGAGKPWCAGSSFSFFSVTVHS